MIKQDYLLAMIEHFFKLIARALGIKETNPEALVPELDKLYNQFLDNNREHFLTAGITDIYTTFGTDAKGLAQTEMLAELFYRELMLFHNPEQNKQIATNLIALYDYLDVQTREFSIERMNRRNEIAPFLV